MAMDSHDTSFPKTTALPHQAAAADTPASIAESGCDHRVRPATPVAPAPGGAAAPFLDIGCGNVPKPQGRPPWSKQQWLIRRAVLDRLNYWMANGYQSIWATLTSSPSSPVSRLRRDFQTLRKRMARQLGFDGIQYVCVDTREGHGVLHMIWAWKCPHHSRKSFYIDFEWLQANWNELHGAFHVHVKRIGGSTKDARRLSRYIVSQYCGDQDGLVRLSQSKPDRPMTKMREALRRTFKAMPERHEYASTISHLPPDEFAVELKKTLWQTFKRAWDELVRGGSCELFGVQFVWFQGQLERV